MKGWVNQVNDFWMLLKKYAELGRDEIICFCRAPTLLKSTKELFSVQGVWHSPNRYPLGSSPPTRLPIFHLGTCWAALWVWTLGTFTSTQGTYWSLWSFIQLQTILVYLFWMSNQHKINISCWWPSKNCSINFQFVVSLTTHIMPYDIPIA